MLSVGDLTPLDANAIQMSQDTATHVKWSYQYNADAEPYTTPHVVKEWYLKKYDVPPFRPHLYQLAIRNGGMASVQWNDPTIQTFFAKDLPSKKSGMLSHSPESKSFIKIFPPYAKTRHRLTPPPLPPHRLPIPSPTQSTSPAA